MTSLGPVYSAKNEVEIILWELLKLLAATLGPFDFFLSPFDFFPAFHLVPEACRMCIPRHGVKAGGEGSPELVPAVTEVFQWWWASFSKLCQKSDDL